jgi:hypothetical protein
MTTVVLIHGGKSTGEKLAEALPGANVVVIYEPGLSGAYDEKTGLAARFPYLEALLAAYAPDWSPGEPLVLLAFSAGAWALRYYLRDPHARNLVDAAVFLDGLYGNYGTQCDLSPYDGVIAYGKEANVEPVRKRLVMTYSAAHPGPGICSNAIRSAVGDGPGVYVLGFANADHAAQQNTVGPQVVRELIAPWIRSGDSLTTALGIGLLVTGLAVAGIIVWKRAS